jgi:hypothetical protein
MTSEWALGPWTSFEGGHCVAYHKPQAGSYPVLMDRRMNETHGGQSQQAAWMIDSYKQRHEWLSWNNVESDDKPKRVHVFPSVERPENVKLSQPVRGEDGS